MHQYALTALAFIFVNNNSVSADSFSPTKKIHIIRVGSYFYFYALILYVLVID